MTVRYEKTSPLDTPIVIDGDNGFVALDSHTDPARLKPGTLQQSENCRLDDTTGVAKGRKGMKRVSSNSNLLAETEIYATARYKHPNDTDYVCMAADEKAYFVDASDTSNVSTTEVAYQTRDSALESTGSSSALVQAYDVMYLFRGAGLRLPFDLDTTVTVAASAVTVGTDKITMSSHVFQTGDAVQVSTSGGLPTGLSASTTYYVIDSGTNDIQLAASKGDSTAGTDIDLLSQGTGNHTIAVYPTVTLGKYPLIFEGDLSSGTFNRPGTVTITAASNTNPIVVTAANHGYSTGDLVTITDVGGNTNANGTYYITVAGDDTFSLNGRAGNSGYTSGGIAVTESSELPPADFAVYSRNRLCVPVNRDEVQYSDVFSDFSFAATNYFKFNTGSSDGIVSMLPVMDDGMLVLKRHSIMLQTSIGNLANTTITEVTRQMGCVSRKSAISVGGAVFFLSDSGVYSMDFGIRGQDRVGTPITAMRISDNPISAPIHDLIETIDFTAAVKESSAIYFNNRLFLAVPIQGTSSPKASKILIYNVNLKSWESIDSHASTAVYYDDFVVGVYGDAQRLFAVCTDGKLLLLDENTSGLDESGNSGSVSTGNLTWVARTRGYTLNELGEKRWLYGHASIAVNEPSTGKSVFVGVDTQDPDSSEVTHATSVFTSTEEKLVRFGLKKRAYMLDLTFKCLGGTPELRRTQVEAIRSDRLITTFE